MKAWNRELAIARDGADQFFNTSACRDDQGYIMAYESNISVQWCFRFARSKDLSHRVDTRHSTLTLRMP